jgi:hypothetical protein
MAAYPELYEGVRVAFVPLRLIDKAGWQDKVLKVTPAQGPIQ